jgi:serine/threonine protein kinase/tetratricopeptide (TPR) repeat protein
VALIAGTSLGRYEIQTQLGAGGMGEVYLARDPSLGRTVAVKLLPTIFAADPDRLRRFEQEARTSAALNHPRILAIHDVGRAGDQPYIVMEYVRGETLGAYMKRGRLPLARALEIGAEIANALSAAHGARIVHRDLKPANIMITGDGHVKVLDFGLAKFLWTDTAASTLPSSAREQTASGQVLGTPGYMSPEQLLGDRVDARTDIFTLGVILFELVTGQRPYGDVFDLLSATGSGTPIPTAREVDVAVAPEVSEVIARAMAKSPADRYQTAAELETALQRLLVDQRAPTSVPRASLVTWVTARKNRRRLWQYAAMLLAGSLAIGAAVMKLVDEPGTTRTVPADRPIIVVLPLENVTGVPSNNYIGVGVADALTTSLGNFSSVTVVPRINMVEADVARLPVVEIGRTLGATMIVRGSIQQAGDQVRADVSLVTIDGSKEAWFGSAMAHQDDLFSLHNQLADLLLAALRIRLSPVERRNLARPPTEDPQALEAYWHGLELLDRPDDSDFEEAVAQLTKAIQRDPEFSLALAARGEAYRRRSVRTKNAALMGEAEKDALEALRLDEEQPEVRLSLARVYRSTGRPDLAMREVNRVLAEQPENDNAHRLLGELLAGAGRPAEALEELRNAAKIRPKFWRNQEALGLFFYETSRLEEAIDAFKQVAELRPYDAMPFQQIGAMYLIQGNLTLARQNFEKSNELRPNGGSLGNLGTIAYSERRYDDAVRNYAAAVDLEPTVTTHHGNLGDAYQKLGQEAKARAAYLKAIDVGEQALEINPNDVRIASRLGVYYAKVGAPNDALRHANRAVRTNSADPELLYLKAVTLALIGQRDAAMQQLLDALKHGYAVHLALQDDDLRTLRSMREFQNLGTATKSR